MGDLDTAGAVPLTDACPWRECLPSAPFVLALIAVLVLILVAL